MRHLEARNIALLRAITTLEQLEWDDNTDPLIIHEMERVIRMLIVQWERMQRKEPEVTK